MKDNLKAVLGEFKKFIMRGNIMDLAIGIILGASFGKIVSSLVGDIILPVVGLIMGKVSFTNLYLALDFNSYETLEAAKKAGAPLLMYGNFIQTIVDFTIVGFAIFMMVKALNKAQTMAIKKEETQAQAEPTTKECPHCLETVKIKASRCSHCGSDLK